MPLGDQCYTVRENEGEGWEGPKVVAWGIACAQMEQLFKKADQYVVHGHQHIHTEPAPPETLVKAFGCITGKNAEPEQSATQPWPQHWPPYHHRNEPCDMKVGPCWCGAWHVEGEFKLEKDGTPYVNRKTLIWPGDHTGGDEYSSQCDCSQCKSFRVSVAHRGRHDKELLLRAINTEHFDV